MNYPTPDTTTASGHAATPMSKSRKQHWSDEAKNTLRHACRQWELFTVDDLNELTAGKNMDKGNFGPILNWGRKHGLVEPTSDYTAGSTGPKQVWRRLYQPNARAS